MGWVRLYLRVRNARLCSALHSAPLAARCSVVETTCPADDTGADAADGDADGGRVGGGGRRRASSEKPSMKRR